MLPGSGVVNLGIGIPLRVLPHIRFRPGLWVHTEGGVFGLVAAGSGAADAAGNPCGVRAGGSFFDSAVSFAVIRRGLVDVAVIGALQVDMSGNVCNHSGFGYGGGLDLMRYARRKIIAMREHGPNGPKFVRRATLPVTWSGDLDLVTESCVRHIRGGRVRRTDVY